MTDARVRGQRVQTVSQLLYRQRMRALRTLLIKAVETIVIGVVITVCVYALLYVAISDTPIQHPYHAKRVIAE